MTARRCAGSTPRRCAIAATCDLNAGETSGVAGYGVTASCVRARAGRRLCEKLGVSLQRTHLPDNLAVVEILQLFRSFFRSGRDVPEILALVSLEEKKKTWYGKLSGGQKQRLAVACALVGDPELV